MRPLVIGGTQFFGRALVEAALERGDAVTVLSRGERRPPFWDHIMPIAADRRDQAAFTAAVGGREVDAVVDNIAFTGQHVQTAIEALKGSTGHYILTSTGSAYHPGTTGHPLYDHPPPDRAGAARRQPARMVLVPARGGRRAGSGADRRSRITLAAGLQPRPGAGAPMR